MLGSSRQSQFYLFQPNILTYKRLLILNVRKLLLFNSKSNVPNGYRIEYIQVNFIRGLRVLACRLIFLNILYFLSFNRTVAIVCPCWLFLIFFFFSFRLLIHTKKISHPGHFLSGQLKMCSLLYKRNSMSLQSLVRRSMKQLLEQILLSLV